MKIIYTSNAPEPVGPYSQAVEKNGMYFFSGQIALKDGNLINGDISSETHQVLDNLRAILDEAGLDSGNIVKSTIFLTDLTYFDVVNKIYKDFLDNNSPARETVVVKDLPLGARIEISIIAIK